MTCVAVTGATGFVGRQLVTQLVKDGHEVRALARRPAQSPIESTPGSITILEGDVRNRDTVRELVEGAEWVVHLAASRQQDDPIDDIIVRGTDTVIGAAGNAKCVVALSCLGAVASSHSALYRAKWRADMAIRSSGIPFVILQASLVVGPGDGIIAPLAQLNRALPIIPVAGFEDVRAQPVDVGDVVRCILAALQTESLVGQTVALGGPRHMTYRQLVYLVSGAVGGPKRQVEIPMSVMKYALRLFPTDVRQLYASERLAAFQHGVVVSPGVVDRYFGFPATDVAPALWSYEL